MGSSDGAGPRGSGVLRHAARERGWEPAVPGDPDTAEAIERHIERHFGPIAFVWHELASDLVHVDVHVVAPTPERPFHTLVTSGMSDRPMTVPPEAGVSPYAELMMCLPADWPMTAEAFRDDSAYWPIRVLKTVARLPHEYDTWIGAWHSVPNGDPAQPYAPDTPFVGVVVTPMLRCAPEARTVTTDSGKEISLLALVPLHPAEVRLKLTEGTEALLNAFDRVAVSELFDPARPSGG
ncbi:suppressor of fused domain protein [Micromonospora inositola]|uniref:Suppressor of fused protein (SUFU) n=1 Tax=Micromonospora inositola TaxID=47865 RepID=A0A1C5JKM4_9ACTN|nr:suppressor of fused domain protein [Micromonospora inositola]SCG71110.1 Suppressor of fused protein (SUFU) [Micromonospora inositola]